MTAPNTLGLDDDLDSVDLLIAIERTFDFKISQEDASIVSTMGDLHDLLVSKFEHAGGGKCQTSMAFYRVRRALKAVLGDIEIRPDTALSAIWNGSPKQLFQRAQHHCDLRLASLSRTNMSGFGGLLIAAAVFASPILLFAKVDGWLILALAAGFFAQGFALTRLDPLAFGPSMVTVGDLARRTANQNYGVLVSLGGRSNAQAIWDALAEVAATFSDLPPEKIERATVILQSQFIKAQEAA